MAKLDTKLKCDNCPDGIVTLIVRKKGVYISASVKKCDKCGKGFGLTSIQHLEQLL